MPGAEHHHHRVLGDVRCRVDQRQPQRLRERRCRSRRNPFVEVGNRVRDHAPVGQRIAGARGCLRPVGVDRKAAVRPPADVAGVHEKLMVPGHFDSGGGTHVTGMGEHQFRRKDAFGEQATRPVEIREYGIEHAGPLDQSGLQHFPIGAETTIGRVSRLQGRGSRPGAWTRRRALRGRQRLRYK